IRRPEVWQAPRHVHACFDPLPESHACHKRFHADPPVGDYRAEHGHVPAEGLETIVCPICGVKNSFTEPRMFSGLMRTYLGPVQDEKGLTYLRPETAQGIFVNYKNVEQSARRKLPFGIGQIAKSFRNEIT